MPRDPRDLSVTGPERGIRRVAELEDQKQLIRLRVGSGPAGPEGKEGKEGKEGPQGKEGKEGPEGKVGRKGVGGQINGEGKIIHGEGFTVERTSAGHYTIKFKSEMVIIPTVVCTSVTTFGHITITEETKAQFKCITGNAAGTEGDHAFNFWAFE